MCYFKSSPSGGVLPPGHCYRVGGHELHRRHNGQVADIHQQIQASHQRNGYHNGPRKIHLVGEKEGNIISVLCIMLLMELQWIDSQVANNNAILRTKMMKHFTKKQFKRYHQKESWFKLNNLCYDC